MTADEAFQLYKQAKTRSQPRIIDSDADSPSSDERNVQVSVDENVGDESIVEATTEDESGSDYDGSSAGESGSENDVNPTTHTRRWRACRT